MTLDLARRLARRESRKKPQNLLAEAGRLEVQGCWHSRARELTGGQDTSLRAVAQDQRDETSRRLPCEWEAMSKGR